jgi:hypothetical protein
MTPEAIGYAAGLILSKRVPVTLYVREALNHAGAEVTDRIPTGRTTAVMVGRYDRHITLDELSQDCNSAQAELTRKRTRAS